MALTLKNLHEQGSRNIQVGLKTSNIKQGGSLSSLPKIDRIK